MEPIAYVLIGTGVSATVMALYHVVFIARLRHALKDARLINED